MKKFSNLTLLSNMYINNLKIRYTVDVFCLWPYDTNTPFQGILGSGGMIFSLDFKK